MCQLCSFNNIWLKLAGQYIRNKNKDALNIKLKPDHYDVIGLSYYLFK